MCYGIILNGSSATSILDNDIQINCNATNNTGGQAFGLMVNGDYIGRIERNKILVSTTAGFNNACAQAMNFSSDSHYSSATSTPQIYNNILDSRATALDASTAIGIDWYASGPPYAASTTTLFFNPVIRNNTFRFYGDSVTVGFALGGLGSPGTVSVNLTADNNLIYGASTSSNWYGVRDMSSSTSITWSSFKSNVFLSYYGITSWIQTQSISSVVSNTSLGAAIGTGPATGTIAESANPSAIFMSEGTDFRLTPYAITLTITIRGAVNGATAGWNFSDDITGVTRAAGMWSVGAYHYQ
jgi:hypothetical protein